MSPLDSIDPITAIDDNDPHAAGGRRLSDKILAAFNHAYAVGETEVANKLKAALVAASAPRAKPGARMRNRRATDDPIGRAEMWVAFVEARNRYKQLSEAAGSDAGAAAEALTAMKHAYKAWSTG